MKYDVISTGSKGNAVVINDIILIDCGVSFKALKAVYKKLKIICLTHGHSDHFNKTTLRRLAAERPALRFACGEWLKSGLLECEVKESNIDILKFNKKYDYGAFKISPVKLYHDVPNCGYRVYFGDKKMFYATDTSTLEGIEAKGYDLYMLEANYGEDEIEERIQRKQEQGIYAYEYRAKSNHLSKEQCDAFIINNCNANSGYVYLHQHEEARRDV